MRDDDLVEAPTTFLRIGICRRSVVETFYAEVGGKGS